MNVIDLILTQMIPGPYNIPSLSRSAKSATEAISLALHSVSHALRKYVFIASLSLR